MRPGYCAGLVASRDDGLIFPRTIVQVPDTRSVRGRRHGRVGPEEADACCCSIPQALPANASRCCCAGSICRTGSRSGSIGASMSAWSTAIFRFDALSRRSGRERRDDHPGTARPAADTRRRHELKHNSHPLKHFVFDAAGRLFVNIGAPSDACAASAQETKPCAAGEGPSPLAAVWMFTPPSGGIFPALRPGETGPQHEVFARGLRNSMALAVHPRSGSRCCRARMRATSPTPRCRTRRSMCWSGAGITAGRIATIWRRRVPSMSTFLKAAGPYRDLCNNAALYRPPHSVMPPHGAPLGMLYYGGEKFPALKDKLIVSLHGYRPTREPRDRLRH